MIQPSATFTRQSSPAARLTQTSRPPAATATPTLTAAPPSTPTAKPPSPTPSLAAGRVTPVLLSPSTIPAGSPLKISSLSMSGASKGWAVGKAQGFSKDLVLTTQDGGRTWRDVTPPEPAPKAGGSALKLIAFFLNTDQAWVTAFTDEQALLDEPVLIWRTGDGGKSWIASQPLDTQNLLMDFFIPSVFSFADARHGWLMVHLGAGMMHEYVAIYTTSDGGDTWTRVVDPENDGLSMSCYKTGLAATGERTAWVAGNCQGVTLQVYFFKTVDGGKTWPHVDLPAPASIPDLFTNDNNYCGMSSVTFLDGQHGYGGLDCMLTAAAGSPTRTIARRWLVTTADGGQTWRYADLPLPDGTLEFINPQVGWYLATVAQDQGIGSRIYHTLDGGKTWKQTAVVNWAGPLDFVEDRTGWVIAKAGNATALVETMDGGASWQELSPVVAP